MAEGDQKEPPEPERREPAIARDTAVAEAPHPGNGAAPESPQIFISYRRGPDGDEASSSRLHDALAEHFGAEHVFLDVSRLASGENFVRAITDRVEQCDVMIVVIGPHWLEQIRERHQQPLAVRREDYVRIEVEAALRRWPRLRVVPVLVGDAKAPRTTELPRPVRRLGLLNAKELHHTDWWRDFEALVADLENPPPVPQPGPLFAPPKASANGSGDEQHRTVASKIARGRVVPVLGPNVNPGQWSDACEFLPNARDLAEYLANEYEYDASDRERLAAVAEYVHLCEGPAQLSSTLSDVLGSNAPSDVHRFLARVPSATAKAKGEPRYQLIVTTNYDDALERAFDEVNEPYDLAVYMASGAHAGRFLHVPYDSDEGVPVVDVKGYSDFPIDPLNDEIDRTVIVKVHGALRAWPIEGTADVVRLPSEDLVLTEDNYINFLSTSPVEDVVPSAIFNKLMRGHILFLGYSVRDWSLRVLLHRIWKGKRLPSKSWAVQPEAETLADDLWALYGVHLREAQLDEYVKCVADELAAAASGPARP